MKVDGVRLRRALGRAVVALLVGSVSIFALSTPAQAEGSCDSGSNYSFFRLDPTKKYLTVDTSTGFVRDTGTVQGWYQAFYTCYDSSWPAGRMALKSAATGQFIKVDASGRLRVTDLAVEFWAFDRTQLWINPSSDVCGTSWCTYVWAINGVSNGLYLSGGASDHIVRSNTTFIGWYQAFEGFPAQPPGN